MARILTEFSASTHIFQDLFQSVELSLDFSKFISLFLLLWCGGILRIPGDFSGFFTNSVSFFYNSRGLFRISQDRPLDLWGHLWVQDENSLSILGSFRIFQRFFFGCPQVWNRNFEGFFSGSFRIFSGFSGFFQDFQDFFRIFRIFSGFSGFFRRLLTERVLTECVKIRIEVYVEDRWLISEASQSHWNFFDSPIILDDFYELTMIPQNTPKNPTRIPQESHKNPMRITGAIILKNPRRQTTGSCWNSSSISNQQQQQQQQQQIQKYELRMKWIITWKKNT